MTLDWLTDFVEGITRVACDCWFWGMDSASLGKTIHPHQQVKRGDPLIRMFELLLSDRIRLACS